MLQTEKASSLAIDSLLDKSLLAQPEIKKINTSTAKYLAYESPLAGEGIKNSLPSGKELSLAIDSLSGKSLSQIKSIESMQKANTLESYLSRKN